MRSTWIEVPFARVIARHLCLCDRRSACVNEHTTTTLLLSHTRTVPEGATMVRFIDEHNSAVNNEGLTLWASL